MTNSQGDFIITAVPVGSREVIARRIGFTRMTTTVTVAANGDVRADFTMTPAASQLEAIVVSGTAGTAEKRTIGNAVTQIDAATVTAKTSLTTVSSLLQSRAPGLVVGSGAGTAGAAAEITIRGYGSLTSPGNHPAALTVFNGFGWPRIGIAHDLECEALTQREVVHRHAVAVGDFHDHAEERVAVPGEVNGVGERFAEVVDRARV